ncbi:MAG TPA: hypothetical protein VK589_28275 [Chryseolinea sp.]|nr:hypothetical protein [Chryseolinea sp.]
MTISCSPTGVQVEIRNRSDLAIDSIRVYTSTQASEILFARLDGGETQLQFLNMEEETAVDGKFYVTYSHGSATYHEPIGNFTNGVPLFKELTIVVAPNGVRSERR